MPDMTGWPQNAVEAIYKLARAVHDLHPTDRSTGALVTECEHELHTRRDDPAQTDFAGRLALQAAHEHALNGSA